jgi:quercetin dioxygenase-like cupin family protein
MTTGSNRTRALLIAVGAMAVLARPAQTRAKDAEEMIVLSPQSLKFIAIPDMPACATAAILRGNPRFGPAWVLLKLASGCRVPWHWHTANETLVVVSGRGTIAMKDGPPLQFVPGAYASLPSNHPHQATCTRTCLLFNGADAAFDIHYVDQSGQEIPLEKALTLSAKPKRKRK